MYRNFCVVLLCVFVVQVESGISDCGSQVGAFKSVSVSDCDLEKQPHCILKRGANATITIIFDVDDDVTQVESVVHGVLGGVPVPFNIPNPDACKDGLPCPLSKPGGSYTYVNTLFVKKSYPPLSLRVRWELRNQNDTDIVCAEIPAKIQ
ncbi:NPC intracellular cholesterol transporter 2 homolog a [Venturia canescens]|uniref:NPC intracellular cholesterol transporter 2 homolog a n=1 Tax=Venturia canescens TaxID=32260 RepID=UPI001C9C830D|nr:NPC intracellular cholesterol transporter 2 homolog a [Venturia canescens]